MEDTIGKIEIWIETVDKIIASMFQFLFWSLYKGPCSEEMRSELFPGKEHCVPRLPPSRLFQKEAWAWGEEAITIQQVGQNGNHGVKFLTPFLFFLQILNYKNIV